MTPHLILPSHFVFRPRMHTNGRRADTRTRLIRDPSDSSSPYSRDNLQMRKGCCGDEKRDGERERESWIKYGAERRVRERTTRIIHNGGLSLSPAGLCAGRERERRLSGDRSVIGIRLRGYLSLSFVSGTLSGVLHPPFPPLAPAGEPGRPRARDSRCAIWKLTDACNAISFVLPRERERGNSVAARTWNY